MHTEAPVRRIGQEDTTWHALVPRLLHEHGSRTVAEIGVWRGELSAAILANCPAVEHLILVDPWQVVYGTDDMDHWMVFGPGTTQDEMEQAAQVVRDRFEGEPRVTVLRQPSTGAAQMFPDGSLDAVLIDALHTYHACKEDILAWWPKLRPGGVMIGDDLNEYYPGVRLAVEEIFGSDYRALGQTYWRVK